MPNNPNPPPVQRVRDMPKVSQASYDAAPPALQRIMNPPDVIHRDADKNLHKGTTAGKENG